ncbi:unnamed protein product [Calypogeia fissa]
MTGPTRPRVLPVSSLGESHSTTSVKHRGQKHRDPGEATKAAKKAVLKEKQKPLPQMTGPTRPRVLPVSSLGGSLSTTLAKHKGQKHRDLGEATKAGKMAVLKEKHKDQEEVPSQGKRQPSPTLCKQMQTSKKFSTNTPNKRKPQEDTASTVETRAQTQDPRKGSNLGSTIPSPDSPRQPRLLPTVKTGGNGTAAQGVNP